jgi:hypothetical protein
VPPVRRPGALRVRAVVVPPQIGQRGLLERWGSAIEVVVAVSVRVGAGAWSDRNHRADALCGLS